MASNTADNTKYIAKGEPDRVSWLTELRKEQLARRSAESAQKSGVIAVEEAAPETELEKLHSRLAQVNQELNEVEISNLRILMGNEKGEHNNEKIKELKDEKERILLKIAQAKSNPNVQAVVPEDDAQAVDVPETVFRKKDVGDVKEIIKEPADVVAWLSKNYKDTPYYNQYLTDLEISESALRGVQDWTAEELFLDRQTFLSKPANNNKKYKYEALAKITLSHLFEGADDFSKVPKDQPQLKEKVGDMVKEVSITRYA